MQFESPSGTPPRSNPAEQPDDQKPHRAHEAKQTQASHAPQDDTHVNRAPLRRIHRRLRPKLHPLQPARGQHHRREREITEHPHQDDGTAEALVIILLAFGGGDDADFLGGFGADDAHFCVVLSVEIAVVLRDVDVDFAAWFEVGTGELFGFVVAFGAPGYVVGVAEGVDVEDVDVGGGKEEVLDELFVGCQNGGWLVAGPNRGDLRR